MAGKVLFGATAALGGYQTLFNLRYIDQPNQVLVAGNNTVGGKTLNYVNTAGSAVAAAIVNGTGLIFQPNVLTGYDWSAGATTAPATRITMANIDARITLATPLAIWIWRSSNPTGAGKYMFFGSEKPTGAQSDYFDYNGNGAVSNEVSYMVMSNNIASQLAGTVTTDVSVIQLPNGLGGQQSVHYIGTYPGSDFPSVSSLLGFSKGIAVVGSAPFGSIEDVTKWDIVNGAEIVGGAGTFVAAFGHLRVTGLLTI